MNKIFSNLSLLVAFLAIAIGLTSCGAATDNTSTISILFEPTSLELKPGEKATVKFNVTSPESLAEIKLLVDGIGTVQSITKDFTTKTTHTASYTFTATEAQKGKTINIILEAKDVKSNFNSRTLAVKVTDGTPPPPPPVAVNAFTMVLMGAQANSALGSFADLDAGKVFKLSESSANSAAIDLGYYYSTTAGTGAVLASPNSTFLAGAFPDVSKWTKRNTTMFYTVSGSKADFDGITADQGSKITDMISKGAMVDGRITGLTSDKVYGFSTEAGKKGLMLVKSVQGTTDGSITIDVKILK